MNDTVTLCLLSITIVSLVFMLFYVAHVKNKQMLHRMFLLIIIQLIIWNFAVLLGCMFKDDVELFLFIEKFPYLGAAFASPTQILLALSYNKNYKGFSWKQLLLYVIPVITIVMIWTNDFHHLFYRSYSTETGYELGPYFYVYAVYSYLCTVVGMAYLCYYAFKNIGKVSVQAVLLFIGSLIPMVTNICYTMKVPGFSVSTTPVAFTITILLYLLAMIKFDFLKVMPIALQTVMNQISDSFVVIGTDQTIIDFNMAFRRNFLTSERFLKSGSYSVEQWAEDLPLPEQERKQWNLCVNQAVQTKQTAVMDISISLKQEQKYYTVEFTPIYHKNFCSYVVVLFKDITQHMLDLATIKKNQEILLERERLASLGQMIGGIAHNLKTPIMSVSGGIEQMECLAKEYEESIEDPEVLPDDHREIAEEMLGWLQKMRNHMSYMSDIISTVKDQAAQFNASQKSSFSLDKLLKRVKILMQHELVKNNCNLAVELHTEPEEQIEGDINSLVQIMDNIIANAIQAYAHGGEIRMDIRRQEDNITIQISDSGPGIDEKVQDVLFKKMITTKGKHGTGLGLYMSYSTIKGVFGGDMWFTSKPGVGTSFYISIPAAKG